MNKVIIEFYLHYLLQENGKYDKWYLALSNFNIEKPELFWNLLWKYKTNKDIRQ